MHSCKSHTNIRDILTSLSLEFYISRGICSLYSYKGKEFSLSFFPSVTQHASNIQGLVPPGFSISFLSYKVAVTNCEVYELYEKGPLEGQDTQGLKSVQCKKATNTSIWACQIPGNFYRRQG